PAGKAQEALLEWYRVCSLLGCGGFGSVFMVTRLSDGTSHSSSSTEGIVVLPQPNGTSAPLDIVLLDKVSTGFPGVVLLLEWLELPNKILMVLEHP
ncbi:PIM1 kinase, partial [Locustella ochotensis]|nr:PIM1 kinase [Locustella ochotensis]